MKPIKYIVIAVLTIFAIYGIYHLIFDKKPEPKINTVIKWVPAPYEVEKLIDNPVPYAVVDTFNVPIPYAVHDTVYNGIDTAKIVFDYFRLRKYSLNFSNDSIGEFKVDAQVNMNKLISATSHIKPNIKTVTITKTVTKAEKLQFYGTIGSSVDFSTNKAQINALFYNKILIGVSGIRLNNNYGYTLDFGVKF